MKNIPVSLGKKVEITIDSVSHQGEGIGRVENFAIFVPGVIKEEEIRVKITEIRKNFARGELDEIIVSSPNRVKPPCFSFSLCGGCHLQHIIYKKQLEIKKEIVKNTLSRIGQQSIDVLPTIGMEIPWQYRNKGYFHLARENNHIKLGFYQAKSHELVTFSRCLLFSQNINLLIKYLEEALTKQKITIYNHKTDSGNFRGILLRESKYSGEIMIIFVTKEDKWALDDHFLNHLVIDFPQIVSIFQNVNKNPKMALLGKEFNILKGKTFIEDHIGPYTFKISPSSFFQVNVFQTETLYKKISETINLRGKETVIDSYCGAGTISVYLAGKAKKIYGLELHRGAVKDAWYNGRLNGLSNLKFFSGKAEKWLYKWMQKGEEAEVVIIDPPRKGCSREVLKNVIRIDPEQILYVSCDMATMARDIKYITQNGYKLKFAQPVDMFPQTRHIECLIYLTR